MSGPASTTRDGQRPSGPTRPALELQVRFQTGPSLVRRIRAPLMNRFSEIEFRSQWYGVKNSAVGSIKRP